MGGIFINYRRHPERDGFARALYDRLAARFGGGNVFLDVTTVRPGERYPNRLRRHLDRADVVVAVVHDSWVADLRDGQDWGREELEIALAEGKTIIPLLVDGAEMPTAKQLPRSIRELAYLQAHVVRTDHDLAALLDEVGDRTMRSAGVRQSPERAWAGPLALVLAAAAVVVPALLWPSDAREVAVYASIFGQAILVAVLISVSVVALARKPINASEREAHRFHPTRYYLWFGIPAATLMSALVAAVVFSSPTGPEQRIFLIFITGASVLYLLFIVIRQYRDERHREQNWPVKLPEPVRAVLVRRELDRLRSKLATGDEKRIRWHVRHLENAADVLARDANRGRWKWLTADQPVQLLLYAVCAGACVGLMTAAALPTMRLWVPALTFVITVVIAAITGEIAFRRQRWMRHRVADEVHGQTQRILDALVSSSGEAGTEDTSTRSGS